MKVVHAATWNGIRCITPKSDDEPIREYRKLGERTWMVAYDPDGTFPIGAYMGRYEIYFGLKEWVFNPGTELVQLSNNSGDRLNRKWIVKLRHNDSIGDFLDAFTYVKLSGGRQACHWLMAEVFGRMSTVSRTQIDNEQMRLERMEA